MGSQALVNIRKPKSRGAFSQGGGALQFTGWPHQHDPHNLPAAHPKPALTFPINTSRKVLHHAAGFSVSAITLIYLNGTSTSSFSIIESVESGANGSKTWMSPEPWVSANSTTKCLFIEDVSQLQMGALGVKNPPPPHTHTHLRHSSGSALWANYVFVWLFPGYEAYCKKQVTMIKMNYLLIYTGTWGKCAMSPSWMICPQQRQTTNKW